MTQWSRRPLASFEVSRIQTVDPSKHPDRAFLLFSIPAHDAGGPESLPGKRIGSSKKRTEAGRVLLSKLNPRINRVRVVHIPPGSPEPIASVEWLQFDPGPELAPEFLAYQLQQDSWRDHFAKNVSGVGGSLMRLRRSSLKAVSVVIPTLPEQHRIVDALDTQFSRLDAAVSSLTRAKANVERARASVLKAAVEGRLVPTEAELARDEGREYEPASVLLERILEERRERHEAEQEGAKRKQKHKEPVEPETDGLPELPEGWVWAGLDQLGELARGMSKHRPRNDPRLLGGQYPLVQTSEVRSSGTFIRHHEATYSDEGLAQSRLWPKGTLCITIAANIAETGILAFDACFPDSVVGLLNPTAPRLIRWVELFMRTARGNLEAYAPATAQKNINLKVLRGLGVPLPPPGEQRRIVAEIDRCFSILDTVEATIDLSLARCDRLRQAILKKAFEGRLVPSADDASHDRIETELAASTGTTA